MKLLKTFGFGFPKALAKPLIRAQVQVSVEVEVDTDRVKRALGVKTPNGEEVPA